MTTPEDLTLPAAPAGRWSFLTAPRGRSPIPRLIGRLALGGFLLLAGTGHLGPLREEFQAQVPTWLPLDPDFVVVTSGIVEVSLGAALIAMNRYRVAVGWIAAAFFVAIFPGNISQWMNGVDAFGLESDQARFIRMFFQPVLVAWALWSTEAWRAWRGRARVTVSV